MKINTVAAVLKKERTVRVFHDEKNQALTNGHALYMINDLPPITTCEQLAAIIGLTKEQAGKFNLKVENEMPPIFSCKNVEESYLEKSNLEYVFYGEKYSAFRNDSVLLFVIHKLTSLGKCIRFSQFHLNKNQIRFIIYN